MNIFYDGKTNRRHDVSIEQGLDGITLFEHGSDIAFFSIENMILTSQKPLVISFKVPSVEMPRLEVHDGALAEELLRNYPIKSQTVKSERKNTRKILLWSAGAIVATVGFLTFGMPLLSNSLAKFVPISAQESLGKSFDGQVMEMFGQGKEIRQCNNEKGKAAFDKLIAKLELQSGLKVKLKPKFLDLRMVNAFATTGGYIYMMDGLLQRAESPDQFAGVIAHEIGHLQNQHVMRRIIEVGGIGLFLGQIFGDFTGSTAILFIAKEAISAKHSRNFETESDLYGVELMRKVGGDPRALATMLDKIDPTKSGDKSFTDWMRSHPVTTERMKIIRDAAGDVGLKQPILSGEEWLDLKDICKNTRSLPMPIVPLGKGV